MRIVVTIAACATCAFSFSASAENAASDMRKGEQILMGTKPMEIMTAKITVSNWRKSYNFYTKVIGLKEMKMPSGFPKPALDDPKASGEVCLNFSGSRADPFICLLKAQGAALEREQARLIWVSFKVPDAGAAVGRVKAAGLKVEELWKIRGMVVGIAYDPDGYTVQFLQAASFKR